MSAWPIVPLAGHIDEVSVRKGDTTAEILSVTNTAGFVRSLDVFDKQVFSQDASNYKLVQLNDLAYNPSRINVGSVARCHLPEGGAVSPMYIVVRCRQSLSPQYLHFFLKSDIGRQHITHRCVGAVRFMLRFGDLERIELPLPPRPEQDRVVRILDEADRLWRLRVNADERTGAAEAALFQELFGVPSVNPLAWPIESVGDLVDRSRGGAKCGPFGSALKKDEYTDSGIPVWGIPNVLANVFVEDGSLFIPRAKFQELRSYAVQSGDLLISRAGTVGRICVARPRARDSIIGTNLIRLSLDERRILPEFFAALLTHFAGEVGQLRADTNETSYSFMSTTVLKSLRIYLPPLELQELFVERRKGLLDLMRSQAASRQRITDLSQSLFHRAFQGEL
jgi:type I restriction enzyme S subunit